MFDLVYLIDCLMCQKENEIDFECEISMEENIMVISSSNLHKCDYVKNKKDINTIYKFVSFNQDKKLNNDKIDTLNRKSLYMTSPLNFNDPYDCELSFNLLSGFEDFLRIGLNREQRRAIKHNQKLKSETKYETEKLQKELEGDWTRLKKQMSVCCFTESVDNFLMWSHYANAYNGVCIEYDLNEIRDLKYFLSPVLYTDKLIRAIDYITKEDLKKDTYNSLMKAAILSVLSKQSQWEYENEWRIINIVENDSDRYISMPPPKTIYVGFKVDDENRKKIKKVADNLKIGEIKETKISTDEYKLVHNPMK